MQIAEFNKNPRAANCTRGLKLEKARLDSFGQGERVAADLSGGFQVIRGGFAGFPIRDNVKGDLLSFVQAIHAGTLDGADVDKNVLAAVIWLDEAKAFLAVEPLHGSLRHENTSFSTCLGRPRNNGAGSK
jgi:hypothetical protein